MFAQRSLSGISRLLCASLLLLLALPVLTGARAAPPAHASKLKACPPPKPKPGEKPPVYIRVDGVSCTSALALARKVKVKAPKGCLVYTDKRHIRLSKPCRSGGYSCTSRKLIDGMALEATCRRGAKLVRFQVMY